MGYGNIEVRLWIWTRKRRGLWVMHSRAPAECFSFQWYRSGR